MQRLLRENWKVAALIALAFALGLALGAITSPSIYKPFRFEILVEPVPVKVSSFRLNDYDVATNKYSKAVVELQGDTEISSVEVYVVLYDQNNNEVASGSTTVNVAAGRTQSVEVDLEWKTNKSMDDVAKIVVTVVTAASVTVTGTS